MQDVQRTCEVDLALRWDVGYDTVFRSFVNIIATPKGGTHQSGFEAALLKAFRTQVESNARRLKAGSDKVEKDDVLAKAREQGRQEGLAQAKKILLRAKMQAGQLLASESTEREVLSLACRIAEKIIGRDLERLVLARLQLLHDHVRLRSGRVHTLSLSDSNRSDHRGPTFSRRAVVPVHRPAAEPR